MEQDILREPWIPYLARMLLDGFLEPGMRVFEWGVGGSTLYFIDRLCEVVTVEHNRSWEGWWRENVEREYDLAKLHLIEPEGSQVLSGRISDPYAYRSSSVPGSFRAYASVIDQYDLFDLIVVDGRARPSCLAHAHSHVAPSGFLLLDNSDRSYYLEETRKLYEGWDRISFYGHGPYLSYQWDAMGWRRVDG